MSETLKLFTQIRDMYLQGLIDMAAMNNLKSVKNYLIEKDLYAGVCHIIVIITNKAMRVDVRVLIDGQKQPAYNMFWCAPPMGLSTRKQIVASFNTRIGKLNNIVKDLENS